MRLAERIRESFNRMPTWLRVATAVLLSALTLFTISRQSAALTNGCGSLEVSVMSLELTFSAHRFATLLNCSGTCQQNIIDSLVGWDMWFPLAYAPTLSALYLLAEGAGADRSTESRPAAAGRTFQNFAVVAPLVAGLLDLVVENLSLWRAGTAILKDSGAERLTSVNLFVVLGSIGAAIKWQLSGLSLWAIIHTLWMRATANRSRLSAR